MESTIVIKVKFGETLRRFNARFIDEQLDLDMVRLRDKIVGLFNFAPDADFALTYVDEDGDMVTLADEDDLFDVMKQSLNPLRITVRLNAEKTGRSYARSSGSSTPMRSPRIQNPLRNLNTGVYDILKSVPEPFRDAFSKLPADLASKATSSSPGLADLVESFSKMGLTYLYQLSESHAVPESNTSSGAAGRTFDASYVEEQQGSKVGGTSLETGTKSEVPIVGEKNNVVFPNSELVEPTSRSDEVGFPKVTEARVLDNGFVSHKANDSPGKIHISRQASVNVRPPAAGTQTVGKMKITSKPSQVGMGWNPVGFGASNPDYLKRCLQDSQSTEIGGNLWGKPFTGSGSSSGWTRLSDCPFSGMPLGNDPALPPLPVPPLPFAPRVSPFKRSYNHGDGSGSIFHRGVCCDGCGVHPITGPRFKSKVKEDYDLCSICFAGMGNETDFIRMDRPSHPRQPFPLKGMHDLSRMCPATLPHQILRGSGMKTSRPKLDSRFIRDINVLDGTIMAPSTPFTKIWRMRNNGTIVWPRGSQLLWIGGDRLSNTFSIEVEIPADGVHVDKELDIAVDFTAPELPGRYISYWRMASPSGQKFGQRVWVLIQVDSSPKDSHEKDSRESVHELNLNLPPVGSGGITGPEIVSVNMEPIVEDSFSVPPNLNVSGEELVEPIVVRVGEPLVDAHPNKEQEMHFPINDTLLVGGSESSTATPGSSSISYPVIDFSEGAPTASTPAKSYSSVVQADATDEVNGREQTLLRELEEMGFKQVDLNKEILRMNEYDLEQSVDDLCGVAEWDRILEELEEMGFADKETNKKLLKKNNGSIKHVVLDLIAGEQQA